MNTFELTCKLVRDCLQLNASEPLVAETRLLGGYPEFNSLTIATLIIKIEEAVDCEVADEEFRSEIFETIGTLTDFVEMKMANR